jgi:FG-GAP-like repeat
MSASRRFVLATLLSIGSASPIHASSDASASFTTIVLPVDGDPDAIAVADVNEDGAPDMILANPQAGTVSIMLGDRKGHFRKSPGSPFSAGHLPNDLGIGDFNGDGHLDLLIVNTQSPFVTLLLGDGHGGFHPAQDSPLTTNAKPHPHGVAVGRFCGQAQPLDAVIDSWESAEIELLLNDGRGTLRNGPRFPAGPGSDMPLRSADLNQDGIADVVMPDTAIGQWNSNAVSVLLGDGKCGFKAAPGSPFDGGSVPWSVAIGDVDSDGIPDLLLVPYGPRVQDPKKIAASVLLGDGQGGFHPMPGSPFALPGCANPRRIAVGSVLGNGTHDFAVTCMNSEKVLLFHSEKGKNLEVSSLDTPSGAPSAPPGRGVLLADLRAQGRDDIIVSNGTAGTVTLLLSK